MSWYSQTITIPMVKCDYKDNLINNYDLIRFRGSSNEFQCFK